MYLNFYCNSSCFRISYCWLWLMTRLVAKLSEVRVVFDSETMWYLSVKHKSFRRPFVLKQCTERLGLSYEWRHIREEICRISFVCKHIRRSRSKNGFQLRNRVNLCKGNTCLNIANSCFKIGKKKFKDITKESHDFQLQKQLKCKAQWHKRKGDVPHLLKEKC